MAPYLVTLDEVFESSDQFGNKGAHEILKQTKHNPSVQTGGREDWPIGPERGQV